MTLSRTMRAVLIWVACAVSYFALARLGYRFAIPSGIATLWPASGLMLGLLLTCNRRDWPAIVVGGMTGSVLSDLLIHYSPTLAIAAAAANEFESVVAAIVLLRITPYPVRLRSLAEVRSFVLGAVVGANAVTACVGALMMYVGLHIAPATGWFMWWVGDGLGMLVVTPVVLAVGSRWWRGQSFALPRAIEAAVLVLLFVVIGILALGPRGQRVVNPGPYILFPLLFWAGVRFRPGGAALAALLTAAVTIWFAATGNGALGGGAKTGLAIAAQIYLYLMVATLFAIVTAALMEELKVTAEQLGEGRALYRALVESATDAILRVNPEGRITFANSAAVRLFEASDTTLVDLPLASVVPALTPGAGTPGDVSAEQRGLQAWALAGRSRSGREIPLEASFGTSTVSGEPMVTVILRDITERTAALARLRDAEARMRFAFEASGVGVWDLDHLTGVVRWSESLERLHGLATGTFGGTMQAFLDLVHPDDLDTVRDAIRNAARHGQDSNVTYRCAWPDGSVRWINMRGRDIRDVRNQPSVATGVGIDVTAMRSLEDQYRQAQKMEAVGQLAGGIAHDFNNLLMAITGYSAMLAEDLPKDSPLQTDVAEIDRAATRAASLTRQLLAFSRRQLLMPTVLDLTKTVLDMEPLLRRLIPEDIEIIIRCAPDVGHVRADLGQIEQVILNLALNGRDAMPDGGVLSFEVLNVSVEEEDERRHFDALPGECVMLAVTDTGVGMDAATQARAFEPFFTTKPVDKGTGLGLSTVHGIVNQSGGRIWVYSEPGRGTTFKVYLPCVDAPLDPLATPDVSTSLLASETILLVEDDATLQTLAQRTLEAHGYRVFVATTPDEALALLGVHGAAVDLLLTDIVLPQKNGRLLAEEALALVPGLRVLYMSGYTDDIIFRRGVLASDMQFIAKPFGQSALLRKLREVLISG